MTRNGDIGGVLLDLDGTVYRGSEPVPGAARFVQHLEAASIRYLFVTNRANRTPQTVQAQLNEMGIACDAEHVMTSAQATARFLGGGSAYCLGGRAVESALEESGIAITDRAPDAVVVGLDIEITYKKLETATRLVLGGARFVATNGDRLLSNDDGVSPGNGAIVASIATATGIAPEVVGKPQRPIIDAAIERLGAAPAQTVVVGDNPETDVLAAQNAGVRSALILTGIADRRAAEAVAPPPTWIVEDYDELERVVFG